ncbi:putative WD-repeat protein [Naematelia encephala]|uniref:Putative WD-repeat protein n=1 Tax=Naematelia encephala TaxID=71784 RepID=A0A1Y2APA0_9TREE|nr:putative WD-repeat protein [Naematelia encephala]
MVNHASKRPKNAKAGPSQPHPNSKSNSKSNAKSKKKAIVTSNLFAPFRALGFVTNHVPFAMHIHTPRGALATPTVFVVTSVGRSWMMWNAASMTLMFVGQDAGAEIHSLVVTPKEVFAAAGSKVVRYHRGKEVGQFKKDTPGQIGKLVIYGDQLCGLADQGDRLWIWDIESSNLANQIQFHSDFTATTFVHPATYINKVVVGSRQGELQLWNTRTCSLIHTFPHPTPSSASAITALVQSPALDVIGVGYLDGTIHLFDIRQGELIMKMKMEEGSVTAMSFRMDGPPILATSSSNGSIAVWDLSKGGRIIHVQRHAHEQAVSGLEWVAGQPLLISSSPDNSVKQWFFESPTSLPKLLKMRGGHHLPPTCIRYYGEDGKQILTAGRDQSLRYTSVVRDSRSHELSQGSFAKKALDRGVTMDSLKFPPITSISHSSTRSKDWEDVLTAHAEDDSARTWSVWNKRLGSWTFEVDEGIVQAVCVTACGNFGLVGSSAGEIKMWNMQSGKERRSFSLNGPAPGDSKSSNIARANGQAKKAKVVKKVIQAITGLATDSLNTTVVASTLEGKIYFFDFHTTKLLYELQIPSSITSTVLHRDSGLLALVCDDLAIRLVDIETQRVVRELRGFKGRILDMAFSPDSRWLIASSLDSVIRTYDIPTGRLVDAFRTSSIATSITFSPTGDFLATAHVDSLGVHLWANRAQFADVSLRHVPEDEDVPEIALPSTMGEFEGTELQDLEPIGAPEEIDIYTTPEQLTEGLLTLSLMPRSRWQTLLNLETIKQRNKPKEPPKAPEKAPFFLPTVTGLETRFDLSAKENGNGDAASQRFAPMASFLESDFTRRLAKDDESGDYNAFFEYTKALSPSALDLEIRSLTSLDHMGLFIHALTQRLASHRDFEAVQALLSVFLAVHADVLIANLELKDRLEQLRDEQRKESKRLSELVGYALGTLGFLRSSG